MAKKKSKAAKEEAATKKAEAEAKAAEPAPKKVAQKPVYNVLVNGGSERDAAIMDLSELADVAKGALETSDEVTIRVNALYDPGALAASRRDGVKL